MTIANMNDPATMTGAPVQGSDGVKLGKIHSIYFDNDTDRPEWAAVKSGMFGTHVSLVPLSQGRWDGDTLTVPFDKDALQAAPHHDPDAEISRNDEAELYQHYGVVAERPDQAKQGVPGSQRTDGQLPGHGEERRDQVAEQAGTAHTTTGPTSDDAMTRSEEQLRVGTERRETGRARLRKHVVTENVTTTVPVTHEEVTLEREPITGADRGDAVNGDDLADETREVSHTEEHVVVDKDVVPVERVRLGTETVTEDQQVDETLRKERIDGVDELDRARGRRDNKS